MLVSVKSEYVTEKGVWLPRNTHWHCLVSQKGRGWLIKYWQMFDLILASFLQGEGIVQKIDGWHGRRLPNNTQKTFYRGQLN